MLRAEGHVLVKATGGAGLGDLIRALLSALHYATVSGRGLVPCWDDGLYGLAGEDVFPRLLHLVGIISPPLADLDGDDVAPTAWRGRLHLPFGRVYALERADDWNRAWALSHLSFDQTRFDYPESVLVMWDFDQFPSAWAATPTGKRIGDSPESALRLLARERLRPSTEVLSAVRAVMEARFAPRMIGVHVRKTDERGAVNRHMELDTLFSLLDPLLDKREAPGVFLATDNLDVEQALLGRYPHVVTSNKWFGRPGDPLHFNKNVLDRTQVAIEALVDIYLLAACDWLIHPAESSFSRVAALLGDIPQGRIYSVPPGSANWRRRLRAWQWSLRTRNGSFSKVFPVFLHT
jgi:hypothetical protein